MEELKEFLENEFPGVRIGVGDDIATVTFKTKAGRSVKYNIKSQTPVEFAGEISYIAECYDADDEAELFIPGRGNYGIPENIQDILDDCRDVGKILIDISSASIDWVIKNAK